MQIALGFGASHALTNHAVEKDERGDAHVRGAMDEHGPVSESFHHPAEGLEIARRRSFEIHRDMDVRHSEAGHDTPLVCEGVGRGWQGEIDDRLKARLANHLKLRLGWLPRRAEPVVHSTENADFG
ncbi:MAG: hypothetical protein P4L99_05125 [Chthoniobacter sp.]|nr:hypothetical protein [Chthoniobacter sp.]